MLKGVFQKVPRVDVDRLAAFFQISRRREYVHVWKSWGPRITIPFLSRMYAKVTATGTQLDPELILNRSQSGPNLIPIANLILDLYQPDPKVVPTSCQTDSKLIPTWSQTQPKPNTNWHHTNSRLTANSSTLSPKCWDPNKPWWSNPSVV